ncbi:hypothetical protein [Granulicella mallensis]|uniref:Uncharacterized protein n=1 Tax=Granulicella mallensis (strain ATCC BAA-1857 / DSM 23137 / MP5ACTX8) TaxID=682795 RepID=G8NS61_GRAMM|nr:hypothetical protein [Granulicella mallensis]AEU36269.1 hypothetical protein AciX8_1938 [Granulicella mallensis MP5ACTX8]
MSYPIEKGIEQERPDCLPFRRAEGVQTFSLFWMPARFKTMPDAQREWLSIFFLRFELAISRTLKLEKLQFMHSKILRETADIQEVFYKKLHRYSPVPGQSRSLNQEPVKKITPEEMKTFARSRKNASLDPFVAERAFRFRRDDGDFTKVFMGYGGMTLLFCGNSSEELFPSPPQLATIQKPPMPKFLRKYSMMETMHNDFDPHAPGRMPAWLRTHPSMQRLKTELGVDIDSDNAVPRVDTFGTKSKEVFGEEVKGAVGFEGLAFILPRLTTQDFLSQLEEDVRKWFDVFDIYIRESPEDEGFVIASKHDLRPIFREVLETMREDGYVYWEG